MGIETACKQSKMLATLARGEVSELYKFDKIAWVLEFVILNSLSPLDQIQTVRL